MSVMRRSLTPPSIDPPSSSSIAPSSSVLSVESSIRVPIGSTLKIAAVEFDGTAPCAFAHVSCVEVRTSISSGTRSSADRRVEAVRQKASSVRCSRRVCSAVNFVGRVKSTARMRRRRCGAGFSSGRRPSRAASTRAAIASGLRTGPLTKPPTPRRPRARGRRRRPRARSPCVRPRTRGSCGRGRRRSRWPRSGCSRRRAGRGRRPRCAGRPRDEAEDTVNILAPPTRTASSIGRAGTRRDDAIDELGDGLVGELEGPRSRVPAAGGQHDMRQPGDAGPAVHEREADARPQPEGHEDIAGDGRGGELTHPDHRLRHRYRPNRASS